MALSTEPGRTAAPAKAPALVHGQDTLPRLFRHVVRERGDRVAMREKEDIKEFYLGMKEAGVRGERRWKKKKNWR